MDKSAANEDLQRILDSLIAVLKASKQTRKSVEKKLGISSGYLTRILQNEDLRMSNVLLILRVIGVSPYRFFLFACPNVPGPQEAEIFARLGQPVPSEDEIDQRIRKVLRTLLAPDDRPTPTPTPAPAEVPEERVEGTQKTPPSRSRRSRKSAT
jgi:transcriptional regulator with XRE-family HTH domain